MSHTGIRLRVAIPAGVILEGDSDWLHMNAQLALADHGVDLFDPGKPWHQVLATSEGLTISVQPVQLADDYPDDEDLAGDVLGFGDCNCPCAGCSGCTG